MATGTITQPSALVATWVTVTDIAGQTRTEMRWVPAAEAGARHLEVAVDHAA